MKILRIAQAQINPTVGDIAGNVELIVDQFDSIRQSKADLATFPELTVCGYPPEDLLLKPRFLEDVASGLNQVVQASRGINALVGFAEALDGAIYNSAALISDQRILGVYRKMELPNYGVFDEKRYFTRGPGCVLLELGGIRIILTICEDVWTLDSALEHCAKKYGVQVALNISASPFHAGKLDLRREIMAGFARRAGVWLYLNNLVGGQDELVFDGGSQVFDDQGKTVVAARRFAPDFLVTDLEMEPAPEMAPLYPSDELIDLGDCRNRPGDGPSQYATGRLEPDMGPREEIYEALVLGLGDYVRKNGFKKVVLGLSGGIDSSLVAALAVEALGAENVFGVTMPSQYTSHETKDDAVILAENLGMEIFTVPIESILASYLAGLGPALGEGELGVVAENLQARIRGNILMALSNRFGWLVLTTGNKSETAVGYCTLYGDMAGGFALIKDVPKTLVYRLSEYANQKAGRELIPESVILRPPTAELRPDQKDEDSLPPYDLLDSVLKGYVEEDKVLDEIDANGLDPDAVRDVVRLVDLNEYKRRQAPPGVKITPKAFGRDRRLPITNLYHPGWK